MTCGKVGEEKAELLSVCVYADDDGDDEGRGGRLVFTPKCFSAESLIGAKVGRSCCRNGGRHEAQIR